jgi:hypothetical protein
MNAYAATFNQIGETLDRIAHRADREFRLAREEAADARDEVVIHALRATIADLVKALEPFAEPHPMGDAYVRFNPRLLVAARAALAKAKQP